VHGSRSSLRALRYTAGVALDRAWELEIITVWPDADDPLIHGVPGRYIAARGHAMECQQRALATMGPLVAADVETFLFNARPAQSLIARCEDADLFGRRRRPTGDRTEQAQRRSRVRRGCILRGDGRALSATGAWAGTQQTDEPHGISA
jgi:hypothetical protein